ncbi:MAG: hypothetical protein OHK003_08180 [Anaerolineales bacterium]
MMLKRAIGFIVITAISLALSYAFNYFFLELQTHDEFDQALMLFFLTCAFTFIFFSLWVDGIKFEPKIQFNWLSANTLRENALGIALAFLFLFVYLYFGRTLNDFGVRQVDNLFDADVGSWMRRIADSDIKDFEMRGPHPFTYFIFQPFGRTLNLFTQDPTLSAILLNAMAGGGCVFLMWLFVKRQFGSHIYALLMASLLGVSASHLFFGSVIETYIFSAFALLLFLVLLHSNGNSIFRPVTGSVLTFGITITNFIQNFLAFIVARPRLKEIIRFTGWAIAVSLIFTYLHAVIYPASKLFFLTPDIENEEKFFLDLARTPDWFVIGRLMYLVRTILLYSVIAPKVFILTDEVGSTIPEFRFYKISIGTFHQTSYEGLGQGLVIFWALLLAVSGLVFLWKTLRERKLDLGISLVLCLVFNFVLHLSYGQELFLYSPDWTYALILFVVLGLSPMARNRIFQGIMAVFIILLAYNQWQFMHTILQSLKDYITSIL